MGDSSDLKELQSFSFSNVIGLLNKDDFYQSIEKKLHEAESDCYMLAIAIEDFDVIFNLYGRDITDDMLEKTASILVEWRQDDTLKGYVDNNVFFILIEDNDFGDDSLNQFLDAFVEASAPFQIFLHIGVFKISNKFMPVHMICSHASVALDHTLAENGNCFAFYNESLTDQKTHKHKVISELEDALDKENFQIYLQSQTDREDNMIGAEALVRWDHPEEGILTPGQFLSILEEENLVYLIDRYVWELAVSQLSDWQNTALKDVYISINISQKDFYYLDIYDILTKLMDAYHVAPSLLHLEINEESFVINANRQIINRLREYGFKIVIDKFGSGASSIRTIKDIEVDAIKIDTSFTKEIKFNIRSRIVLETLINMCRRLNMTVMAEGIEDKDDLDFLKCESCDSFQGYYFDKPMPVEEFELKYIKE